MQSTNSEYGSLYLVVCHVTFIFYQFKSLKHKAAGHSCLKKQKTAVNKWRIGTASLMCLYERMSTVNLISFKHAQAYPVSTSSSTPSGKTFMKRVREKETGRGSVWDRKHTAWSNLCTMMETVYSSTFIHAHFPGRETVCCCEKDMSPSHTLVYGFLPNKVHSVCMHL